MSEPCYLYEYWDLIEHREVVVGRWLKKEMRNLIREMDDPLYIYDATEAHQRIRFQETCCLQSKAPFYKKPLILLPWQKAFWEALYSFRMRETGLRRFTESILEVARKNGKSTMYAGDGTTDLFIGPGGTTLCCASNDDKQATLIWKEIGMMRGQLDPKKAITHQNLSEIRNKVKDITIFRLSSKTQNKDGRVISKTYLDESHDIKEENGASEVAEACDRSMSTMDEPLFLGCSTQGFNRDCYLDKKIHYAKQVIEGEVDDIHFLPFLYEQDSEQEIWLDEASWEKSNPSIRYGVKKTSKLRRDIQKAKIDKATRIHMLTKDFNLPQSNAQAWLQLEDYDYPTPVFDLDEFRGAIILGAVDLSATTDLSNAKILLMRDGDKHKYVYSHYWIPESKLESSDDKEAGADYAAWARAGILSVHDGNEIDITRIADWFAELVKAHKLRVLKIGFDERFAKTFVARCDEYSFDTERIEQGRALSNAMKLTEADLHSRIINYGGNPMDKWCLRNCCCKVDEKVNIQPVKMPGRNSMRIDGAVTLIMLIETFRRCRSDFMSQFRK